MEFQAVSGPKFTELLSLNAGGIAIVCNVFRLWISWAVLDIFAIKVWSGPKLAEILHVFGPQKIFWGEPPTILEWDYKIQPGSDHAAKFQGDRSRELGERVAKQKKKKDTSRVKHKPSRTTFGRPNNTSKLSLISRGFSATAIDFV